MSTTVDSHLKFACTPSASKFLSERKRFAVVVPERKLHPIVVEVISIPEVHAPPVLKLAARHHVFDWVEQQVRKCVIPLVKIACRLRIRVPDIQHRSAKRAAELRAPVVIDKRNRTKKW
jgi:hypothetical protein